MEELVWNVLIYDANEIKPYNVFNNASFLRDLYCAKEQAKETNVDFNGFKKKVEKAALCVFWSRAEYELLIKGMFSEIEKKIDAYDQLMLNIDQLTQYIIDNLEKIPNVK